MRFFTSDLHLGHDRIRSLCNRPFNSVDEMNEALIANWNSVVGPDDEVWNLGDVALGKIAESLPLVSRLNGTKFLVPGNHDRIFSGEKQRMRDRFLPEYEKVFDVILPEYDVTILDNGQSVGVCHFPYVGDSQENDRHIDKRPIDEGLPLIHGHIHSKQRVNGRQIHVGVDAWNFYPVSEDEIIALLNTLGE